MTTTEPSPRTYGNWRQPRSPGIAGFGLLGTMVLLGGLVAVITAMMFGGLIAAAITAGPVAATLGLLSMTDKHGRNAGQRLATRVGWGRAKRRGSRLYRSGPLGRTPWGSHQLPGLAARSRLIEARDSYGRPFALVYVPQTNHYTVVLETQPDGASLVDQVQVDMWVAGWGQFLAALSNESHIVAASVTVETAPDTGARLRREVELNLDPTSHPLAQAMLREAADTYPAGSASIRAWVAVTIKGLTPSGKKRSAGEVARDLQARLPGLTSSLSATGAGTADPVSAAQLCEIIRTCYDPASAELFEKAHAMGDPVELDWADVGPAAHDTHWDSYRHDGCWSVSWSMTQAPRGLSFSSVLTQLLSPHPDVDRKRVTLLYRPISSGVAAGMVESDKRNAEFRVNSAQRVSARAATDLKAASAAADEEARGAGLVNFGMLVTATVPDLDRLDDAKAAIENLSAGARILLRPVFGSQDCAFAAGLPLGLVLPAHLKVPAALRSIA